MNEAVIYKDEGEVTNVQALATFLNDLPDGKFLLTAKSINKRSLPQNAYYWSCVIPLVKAGLIDNGFEDVRDEEDTHAILKSLFLKKSISNGIDYIPIFGSTAKLTKLEFSEFIDKVAQWCSEYLNFALPMPNQQTEFFQQQQA